MAAVGVPGVGNVGKSFVGNTMTNHLGKNYLGPRIITTQGAVNQRQTLVKIHIVVAGTIRIATNGGRGAAFESKANRIYIYY